MLLAIGPVRFVVIGFNTHETSQQSGADFAEKPVVGSRPLLEFVGASKETLTVNGKMFPQKLGGGGSLSQLLALKETGVPQFVMRGDGRTLGWFAIEKVNVTNTYFAANGAPRVVEFSVELCRAGMPAPASIAASLFSALFG